MWKSDSGFYLIMLSDTSYQQERLCISLSVCTQNRIFEHKIDKLKTELVTNKQWVICDTKKNQRTGLTMQGCVPNTIKYLLFLFNLLVFVSMKMMVRNCIWLSHASFIQLLGCVVLGFSIYALVDGSTVSRLVEEGASEMGESITVSIYTTSAIILVTASSVIVVIAFLGCCGTIKVCTSTKGSNDKTIKKQQLPCSRVKRMAILVSTP